MFLVLEDYVFLTHQNTTLINLLMSAGEIPDLYTDIEMESLVKGLKDKFDSGNFEGNLHQFFANSTVLIPDPTLKCYSFLFLDIKKYLHVFVCLDKDNVNLRDIIMQCPAFTQISGLCWLSKWSEETVKSFPHKFIEMLVLS